jgi:hypothetical protein
MGKGLLYAATMDDRAAGLVAESVRERVWPCLAARVERQGD